MCVPLSVSDLMGGLHVIDAHGHENTKIVRAQA